MTSEFVPSELFAERYEIQRFLGEGDRKKTYLARDSKMDRLVALSVVKPEAMLADPEGTEREARVLGRIGSHSNIVSLHDYVIDRARPAEFMVFEYLEGGTLADYLQRAGVLDVEDILRFGRQLCRGLAHLHGKRLIHRDVSPTNIWLDERREAHLGDFDSAITIEAANLDRRPITTNAFAAPEELAGEPIDVRSDLFSLGGVLFVLATGDDLPGSPVVLRARRLDLPSSFVDLIASLLSERPQDRPDAADSVLASLDHVRHASRFASLIGAGESNRLEFKASILHPHGPMSPQFERFPPEQRKSELRKELGKAATKSIAAFLNSEGGDLLIGVDNVGEVLGIEADFDALGAPSNSDVWLQYLKSLIANSLGPDAWGVIRVALVSRDGRTVAVIFCPPRSTETWHLEKDGLEIERFYMRASNTTVELKGSRLIRYVREHWRT
jgi:serine/threonine protein kinase